IVNAPGRLWKSLSDDRASRAWPRRWASAIERARSILGVRLIDSTRITAHRAPAGRARTVGVQRLSLVAISRGLAPIVADLAAIVLSGPRAFEVRSRARKTSHPRASGSASLLD